MEFKEKTLDNGLKIIGEVNKSAKSVAIGFFVKTGARDETPEINGVSHFLEHMLFKGTENLSAQQVNEAFDKIGAQFNAFTSEENTVFYSAVLPEYLEEVTKLWSQLMRPSLRDDDFNIEKNVIKEEIAMYQDMPNFDVMDRCKTLFFDSHPCGNSVLGSVESIDTLTAQQMRDYFAKRYAPDNINVAIAGNFDFEQICRTIKDGCGSWQKQNVTRQTPYTKGVTKIQALEKNNLQRNHICLMSPAVSAQDKARFAFRLLATIIGDSNGSRFFWELIDKALAETAAMQLEDMDGTGALYTYIRCSQENTEKVLEIVKGIFAELAKNGITEDELQKAKNKRLSAEVIRNEIPMGRLIDLGFNWIYLKTYRDLQLDIDAFKAVTVADVNSLIKQYDMSKFTQFSIGPAKSC